MDLKIPAPLEIFLCSVVGLLTAFLLSSFLKGSSESSEFAVRKRQNYGKCTSEFKPYIFFMETEVLEEGDLLECQKAYGTYDHWLIYIGGDEVIHLVPDGEKGTEIKKEKLENAMKRSKCRVNNLYQPALERGLLPRSGATVAQRGIEEFQKFQIGGTIKPVYNLMEFNCEHFVTYCAFGTPFSEQADNAEDKLILKKLGGALASSIHLSSEGRDDFDDEQEL